MKTRISLRSRLIGVVMAITLVAVSVTAGSHYIFAVKSLEANAIALHGREAALLSESVQAALLFDDPLAAEETLAALSADPSVTGAAVYDGDRLLATYGAWSEPAAPAIEAHHLGPNALLVRRPVLEQGRPVGAVYVRTSTDELDAVLRLELRRDLTGLVVSLALALLTTLWIAGRVTGALQRLAEVAAKVTKEDYTVRGTPEGDDEIGDLVVAFNGMLDVLESHRRELEARVDARTSDLQARGAELESANRALAVAHDRQAAEARLTEVLRGSLDVSGLGKRALASLCDETGALLGAIYAVDGDTLHRVAAYVYTPGPDNPAEVPLGTGVLGQTALDGRTRTFDDLPEDYVRVASGLGGTRPRSLLVAGLVHGDDVVGVVELGGLEPISEAATTFVEGVREPLAIALSAARDRTRAQHLLEATQRQSEMLRQTNEELEERTHALEASEGRLQEQQEELRAANEELESHTRLLAAERATLSRQNRELQTVRAELEEKARNLAETSRYKSEFLANMSHELRTPLNSILILSKLLADNGSGRLGNKEVEFAETVLRSGHDLLSLVDEVLDLARVEAGQMSIEPTAVSTQALCSKIERAFEHVARDRGLALEFAAEPNTPATIYTDPRRLEQILRNLIGNALKFTDAGGVTVRLSPEGEGVAIAVADTGIGIPVDRQESVWGAFQQVDGTTQRKHGGTGLGLSIVSELVELLGGSITLESESGVGSTFTVHLPVRPPPPRARSLSSPPPKAFPTPAPPSASLVEDDRASASPEDRLLLVVEDDPAFAERLVELARARGFKAVVASDARSALALAEELQPSGMVLDVRLPDQDGWSVLERLRADPNTRGLPVHVVSAFEDPGARRFDVLSVVRKPVTADRLDEILADLEVRTASALRRVLLVEDDDTLRARLAELIGARQVRVEAVGTAEEALKLLGEHRYDCAIVDLGLPGLSGFDLLERLHDHPELNVPPVVVYTGRELADDELERLDGYSDSIVLKGARSQERLIEEVRLFLHRVEAAGQIDPDLAGHKVLVVDDDMRNVYALSEVLENVGMTVTAAENGRVALEVLARTPDVEIVLMDMMMPEMDGYAATRAICADPDRQVPVIALTAKVMAKDRERCLEAGACDYVPKPVDLDRLLSVLRVWLRA